MEVNKVAKYQLRILHLIMLNGEFSSSEFLVSIDRSKRGERGSPEGGRQISAGRTAEARLEGFHEGSGGPPACSLAAHSCLADRSVDFEASKHWERHLNESPRCFQMNIDTSYSICTCW